MNTIIYGSFEKKSPFSQEELNMHFDNNNKFLTVASVERVIEISYGDNYIAIEETID